MATVKKVKKAQSGYSATADRVDSLRAVGVKQLGTPEADKTLKKLRAAEAQERREDAMKLAAPKKKTMKKGKTGIVVPSKKNVGKTIGKLNKAKMGGKMSKMSKKK